MRHAGASGYIAVTLCGLSAIVSSGQRPSSSTSWSPALARSNSGGPDIFRGGSSGRSRCLSVPAAYLGGYLELAHIRSSTILIASLLLFSAPHLFFRHGDPPETTTPSVPISVGAGAGIGFLSGLTGTGGGIFLTRFVFFRRWATFAGLPPFRSFLLLIPSPAWWDLFPPVDGRFHLSPGFSRCGVIIGGKSVRIWEPAFSRRLISLFLATVLVLAGCKLIFT